jgi:hypothetical protein
MTDMQTMKNRAPMLQLRTEIARKMPLIETTLPEIGDPIIR